MGAERIATLSPHSEQIEVRCLVKQVTYIACVGAAASRGQNNRDTSKYDVFSFFLYDVDETDTLWG